MEGGWQRDAGKQTKLQLRRQHSELHEGCRRGPHPRPNLVDELDCALAYGRQYRVLFADSPVGRVDRGRITASDPGLGLAKRNAETTHGHAQWTGEVSSSVTPPPSSHDAGSDGGRSGGARRSAGVRRSGRTLEGERLARWDLADNMQTAASWTMSLDRTIQVPCRYEVCRWRAGEKAFQKGDQTCRRVLLPLVPASGRTTLALARSFVCRRAGRDRERAHGGSLAGSLAIARRRSSISSPGEGRGVQVCRCSVCAAGVCGSYYNETILSGGRLDQRQQQQHGNLPQVR